MKVSLTFGREEVVVPGTDSSFMQTLAVTLSLRVGSSIASLSIPLCFISLCGLNVLLCSGMTVKMKAYYTFRHAGLAANDAECVKTVDEASLKLRGFSCTEKRCNQLTEP